MVPSDPEDEPAKVLLKKIKVEKEEYLKTSKQKINQRKKSSSDMDRNLTIKEVLQSSSKPMQAKEVWKRSKYSENIEAFYAALKKLQGQVSEVEKGLLTLIDEN